MQISSQGAAHDKPRFLPADSVTGLEGTFGDVAAFLIPALLGVEINIGGELYGGDFFIFAIFVALLFRKNAFAPLRDRLPKLFLLFGSVWLVGQIITDLIVHTEFHDAARGWAIIAITLLNFSVLYLLLQRNFQRIVIYGWGLVVGSILTYFFHPIVWASQYPWEFGFGFPVTLAIILLTTGETYASLLLPLAMSAINLLLAFRSLGAICFVLTTYLFLRMRWLKAGPYVSNTSRIKRLVGAAVLIGIGTWGVSKTYEAVAKAGWLGKAAEFKYEFQSEGRFGLILGGRSEILLGAIAIYESPWLGHGSWAKDPNYVAAYQIAMLMLGYDPASFQRGSGTGIGGEENDYLIVAHSHLLGAWVQAGILGTILWFWLLMISVRCLLRTYILPGRWVVIASFCSLWLMWNIFFEPYGGDKRFLTLYYVVVIMVALSVVQDHTKAPEQGLKSALVSR